MMASPGMPSCAILSVRFAMATAVIVKSASAMDEIRRRKAAQAPFRARLRPCTLRAAVDDFEVGCLLLGPRQQRPVATKARAGAGLGGAAMMPPAIAALAAVPRLRHLAEQCADRRKGRFA